MTNIIDLNSRRKPAPSQAPGRTPQGTIPQVEDHNKKSLEAYALSQFMLSEEQKGGLLSNNQIGQVQAGIAFFFGCPNVFMGLDISEAGTEILCIPAYRDPKGEWRLYSAWDFFWTSRKKQALGKKVFKLTEYLNVLSKFVKLPGNHTIRVIRKPTKELWEQFNGKATK